MTGDKLRVDIYEAEYDALLRLENCTASFYKVWSVKRVNLELLKSKVEAIKLAFEHLDSVRRALGLREE